MRYEKEQTTERRRGNGLGFMFFNIVLRTMGLTHARRIAAIICLYYLCFDWSAIRRTMPYAKHIHPESGYFKRLFFIYRLFINQAWMLLDRTAFQLGILNFAHTSEGYENLEQLVEKDHVAVVLLGAHFGNWQLAVEGLKRLDCQVNIVMSPETNPAVKKHLQLNQAKDNIHYIFTDGPDHGGFEIASALCAGEVVCLMGDRAYGTDTLKVSFLGEEANFPYSAWIIAAKTKCAVIPFFISKDPHKGYHVWGDKPIFPKLERRDDPKVVLKPLVERYSKALERMIHDFPEQCFLFSDIWAKQ